MKTDLIGTSVEFGVECDDLDEPCGSNERHFVDGEFVQQYLSSDAVLFESTQRVEQRSKEKRGEAKRRKEKQTHVEIERQVD